MLVGGDVKVINDCLRKTQDIKYDIVDNEDEDLSLKKILQVNLLSPLCMEISRIEEIDNANESFKFTPHDNWGYLI